MTSVPATGGDPVRAEYRVDTLGTSKLVVVVVDDLGNVETLESNVTTVEAITDTTGRIELLTPYPLPGEPVMFRIDVEQKSGVTRLPVMATVQVPGHGVLIDDSVEVAVGQTQSIPAQLSIRPGQYEANLTVSAGPLVNETDGSDQTDLLEFEVFLGKVVVNATDSVYYIRAGKVGQPTHAVSTGGATYPLVLNQTSGDALYQFRVEDRTYSWNPEERITYVPEPRDETKESPAWSLPLLAAALLALAARRRR